MTTSTESLLTFYRWTVDAYHRLGKTGILGEDDRVELLDGQIVAMAPIGDLHAACVKRLSDFLWQNTHRQTIVSVQDPVTLGDFSEPQPDIALLRRKDNFYADGHPRPADVLLLIEVADSSLRKDKEVKLPLYARAGIRECWLINLEGRCIEHHSDPGPAGYKQIHLCYPGEVVTSEVTGEVTVDALLP